MTPDHNPLRTALSAVLIFGFLSLPLHGQDTQEALKVLRAIDHQGAGNKAAKQAYAFLIAQDRSVLPELLESFNGANPLAENYLRSAFEVVAVGEAGDVPEQKLEAYLADLENNQKARALVFEYLSERNPDKMNTMLDSMVKDPSADIRYKAVQKFLDKAVALEQDGKQQAAVEIYRAALEGASEEAQVRQINEALKTAGQPVDLHKHFGLLTDWRIIGPFDNKDTKAFDIAYPPEKEIDFDATYEGMTGEVNWQVIGSEDDMGSVNIATSIGRYKGAVMYMYTEYVSATDQDVYVRLATANAWKLWINDELVFAREEYHRGMRWDQYRIPVSLQKGTNRILFKILQNEQTQDWAQKYEVQFRVCDKEGTALLPVEPYDPTR